MKRLTTLEHAKAKGRTFSMSLPDRGPAARAAIQAWLEQRPSDGCFYATGDNYTVASQADATAFKQWLMDARV